MDHLKSRLVVSTRFIFSTMSLLIAMSLASSAEIPGLNATQQTNVAKVQTEAAAGSNANQVAPDAASVEAAGATWIAIRSPFAGDANRNSYTVYEFSASNNGSWTQVCGNGTPGDSYWRRCWFAGLTPAANYFVRVTFVDPDGVTGPNPQIIGPIQTIATSIPAVTVGTAVAVVEDTHINVIVPVSDDSNTNSQLQGVEIARSNAGPWTQKCGPFATLSPKLCRIHGLTTNTDYWIRVTVSDPDGVNGPNPQVLGPVHYNGLTNLALQKPISGDPGWGCCPDPTYLTDGRIQNPNWFFGFAWTGGTACWAGGCPPGSKQTTIDLGSPLMIDRVDWWTHDPGNLPLAWKILVSTDGSAYTEVFSTTEPTCRTVTQPLTVSWSFPSCAQSARFAPVNARFVRYTFDDRTLFDGIHGWGVELEVFNTSSGNLPAVALSPATLTFDPQPIGTTSGPQMVSLTNTGNSPLSITSIAASGDFAQTNTCDTTVNPGANCNIDVTFTPTGAGLRSGTLIVTDNASDSPQGVTLTGSGKATVDDIGRLGYQLLNQRAIANQKNFYVFLDQDSGFNHGFPSGLFASDLSNLSTIHIDAGCIDDPNVSTGCSSDPTRLDQTRGTIFKVSFDPQTSGKFAGVNIEEPENFGSLIGNNQCKPTGSLSCNGYDLTGATNLIFDARSPDGATVQFGMGGCITPYVAIPKNWTTITIPFNSLLPAPGSPSCVLNLKSVNFLFSVATNDQHAPNGGTVLFDNIRFDPSPASLQAMPSFPLGNQTFGVVPLQSPSAGRVPLPPDQVIRNLTTIYESALTESVLLARGTSADLNSASLIADTFDYVLHHDNQGDAIPAAPDGSIGAHNGYESGQVSLFNDQNPPPKQGKAGMIRLAGFSASAQLCGPSAFCPMLDGATGGNNAFAIFALVGAFQQFGNQKYLDDARMIGNWIVGNLTDNSGTGYGGYFVGYPDNGAKTVIQGKSVENNADIFAALTALAAVENRLGNTSESSMWTAKAKIAGDFVMALFDPANGRFFAGTVASGSPPDPAHGNCQTTGLKKGNEVINDCDFIDSDTFTVLAMAGSAQYHSQIDWRRPVQHVLENFAQSITVAGREFNGFNISKSPSSGPNGIAWEFTGQAMSAMRYVDQLYGQTTFEDSADFYMGQIAQALSFAPFTDGQGMVASTLQDGDQLPPDEQCLSTAFQCIAERVGLAATTWAILAAQNVNPFTTGSDQPVFTNLAVSPSPLPGGGAVALSITITSRSGIATAHAQITNPDFSIVTVPLALASGATTNGSWTGTFNAPTDLSLVGKNYLVTFTATDAAGNSGSSQIVSLPVGQPGQNTPIIKVTSLPAFGSFGSLSGQALNVDPTKFQVAVLLFIDGFGWVSKPFCNPVYVPLAADGTFSANVTTGGVDQTAIRFAAYLVPLPANFTYTCVVGVEGVPGVLDLNAVARTVVQRPNPNERIIDFAGYKWGTKTNSIPLGPGGNNFSDSIQNIFIDAQGALHLKIINVNGKWFSSEIYSKNPVGFGTYAFDIISPLDTLDSNVVGGFFTWTDNPAFSHREIDFEASRFNNSSDTNNAQFLLQPFTNSQNRQRFAIPSGLSESTYGFHWTPAEIAFQAARGNTLNPSDPSLILDQFAVPGPPTPAPDQGVRMNLWVFNPPAPNNGQEAEVVVRNFQYIPDTTLESSVPSLSFGTQPVSTTSGIQTLTIANNGSAPAQIFSIASSGDFAVVPSQTTCANSSTVLAGTNCEIAVQFTPTATGSRTGMLTVNNNTAQPAITISLSGTGVADATATVVSSSANPSAFGSLITLTAVVSPIPAGVGTPTGTVTFFDGDTNLGTSTLDSSSTARRAVSNLSGGSHSITATYNGDNNFSASTSAPLNQIVQPATTATTISSSPNPSVFGGQVTLSAVVTSSAGTPSGNVTFFDGTTSLGMVPLDSNGKASLPVSSLSAGSHSITATYNGSTNFAASTSAPPVTQTINQASTVTAPPSSSFNPSTFGSQVTFTTKVTSAGGTPPGTVTFLDGTATLGTVSLDSNGNASFSTKSLSVGSHSITATYNGSTNFATSTSAPPVTQTANQATTVTAPPSSSFNPSTFGSQVTFTTTVTSAGGTPPGTVTFLDGTVTLGTVSLDSNGNASFSTKSLSLGSHSITATYNGSTNFAGSTSAPPVTQTINQASTVTAPPSSSFNPSTFGSQVTFTTTVTSAGGTPTGTLTFQDGTTTLGTTTLDSNGNASFSTKSLSVGSHSITATYNRSTNFAASTSAPAVTQTVNQASTVTAPPLSSPNPSTFGSQVTFTTTVTSAAGTPTGNVAFLDGTTTLGTATLDSNGNASFSTKSLSVGSHSITATYNGSTNFAASTSAPAVTQTVNPASTVTAPPSSSPNPSTFGSQVTFTTTVTSAGGTPTGTLTFQDGTVTLGTVSLDSNGNASFSTKSLSVGSHSITATYNGSTNFAASTSAPAVTQTVNQASTVTALPSSSFNPSTFGGQVTFTTTVNSAGGTPTGAVTFLDGTTTLGTVPLDSNGNTSFSTKSLSVGPHSITATYNGSTNFAASTSAPPVPQTVNLASTSAKLSSVPNPSVYCNLVTFVATVTSTAGTPTGTVTFLDGGTSFGTATLDSSGKATLQVSSLTAGSHSITATYNGSGNFSTSTSQPLNQLVKKADVTIQFTSSQNPSVFGSPVTYTIVVIGTCGTPTGTVSIFEGTTNLGTISVDASGKASVTLNNLNAGSHALTAVYSGDNNFNGATSLIAQTVTTASTTTSISSSANPSALGSSVTLTAVVTSAAGTPTGTVSFLDNTTSLGTASLDSIGKASLPVTSLSASPHSITAVYNGSVNFSGSTSPVLTEEVVSGLLFVPVTPCRVADTRNPNGPFGGPFLSGGTSRGFAVPDSSCGIPSTAQAFSLNATVVPKSKLGFLTMFACGQTQPSTSTLNSDGRVKAGAAIVPAGTNGSVCALASDDTDLVLDINGYFVPPTNTSLAFYPLTPCRLVDTRTAAGPLGGPSLVGNTARNLPVLSSSCNVPSSAKAYSLNFTSVPKGSLGFLTTWPTGETQPLVSTLNAPTGAVTANAALVPAGTSGDISVFVTNDSDLVVDINGYFAAPAPGGLSLHTLSPCRALDTRVPPGSPSFNGEHDVIVVGSACGVPASVQAVVLNATVVPPSSLGFLTLWPQGTAQPLVSTLNAGDGAVTSNMAIVPTTNGSISAFVSNPSHLILDILGYFVP